jgi:glycosyltransferase involved in cell wall biosynthesis
MFRTLHLDTQPNWRGGQSQALLLMRGLIERGHAAELMAPHGSALAMRASGAGIAVHAVSPNFLRAQMAWELRSILRDRPPDQRFDIVHAHDPHALTAAWLAGAHHHAALVAHRRVAYPLSRRWPGMARYRAASRIIAISQFVTRSIAASGIDASRVAVVHDGVAIPPPATADERERSRNSSRVRWGIAEGDCVLGCVSQLSVEKGQEVLLRGLAALKDRKTASGPVRLLLAGAGKDHTRLEFLARELGIAERVIFAGFVEDVDSVYAALDVFLFPSLAEPLGSSLLDAMARSLPCIAVASGGVPEVIEDGVNGVLLSSPPPPAAFAEAIDRFIVNPAEAARLGAAARDTVESRFSAACMMEGTLAIYEVAGASE